MQLVHVVTHPEVVIDPAVPVPDWPLSSQGRDRMALMLERPWAAGLGFLFSSAERKALDAAEMIGRRTGLRPVVIEALGENDRSATGYLPREEFEATADLFFAHPDRRVRGWERAIDAQARIVRAVEEALARTGSGGDVAIVSHGGVGALLLCHLKGIAITRDADQPAGGGGHLYSFDAATGELRRDWTPIEAA